MLVRSNENEQLLATSVREIRLCAFSVIHFKAQRRKMDAIDGSICKQAREKVTSNLSTRRGTSCDFPPRLVLIVTFKRVSPCHGTERWRMWTEETTSRNEVELNYIL